MLLSSKCEKDDVFGNENDGKKRKRKNVEEAAGGRVAESGKRNKKEIRTLHTLILYQCCEGYKIGCGNSDMHTSAFTPFEKSIIL